MEKQDGKKGDDKKGGPKKLGKGVPEEYREFLVDFFGEDLKVTAQKPVISLPGSLPSWRGTGSSCVYPQQQLPPR